MLYLLNKPNVKFISISFKHWFYSSEAYTYKVGDKPSASRIVLKLKLRNDGGTESTIYAHFTCKEGIFEAEPFSIEGKGVFLDTYMTLFGDGVVPQKGQTLEGVLKIEPWGNRTFLIGRKALSIKLSVPYDLNDRHIEQGISGI